MCDCKTFYRTSIALKIVGRLLMALYDLMWQALSSDLTSTKWTVQPVILTPASRANLWAWAPLKDGNRAGWMLMIRPRHSLVNLPDRIRMKPAKQIRSTREASSSAWHAISNSSLVLYFVCSMTYNREISDVIVFSLKWPGQARPGQARPGQARPGQARPTSWSRWSDFEQDYCGKNAKQYFN